MRVGGSKGPEAQQQLLEKLRSVDAIVTQPGGKGLLGSANLSEMFSNVFLYPKLTFCGFHPDFVRLRDARGKLVRSACGWYHSRIVAAAYVMSLSERRTEKLFNAFIYSRLGYFRQYGAWKKVFLTKTTEIGYDLTDDFGIWLQAGAFMHTPNHPAIRVIATVTSQLMRLIGIEETRSINDMPDGLADATQLPVYDEIAEAVGIEPIRCFRASYREKGDSRDLSLREFIRDCFRLYQEFHPVTFDVKDITPAREVLDREICSAPLMPGSIACISQERSADGSRIT